MFIHVFFNNFTYVFDSLLLLSHCGFVRCHENTRFASYACVLLFENSSSVEYRRIK